MKGLILSAGKGTRLQPLSFSQPKTLLPVANKPVIQYGIEKLVSLGIKEIGIVIHPSFEAQFLEKLGTVQSIGCSITYLFQEDPKGISDAIKRAESFIGQEPFILLLGDNLIEDSLAGLKEDLERKHVNGSIMLKQVLNPREYGVAEIKAGKVINIEEKPRQPKSDLAVIGAYAFDSTIFEAIASIKPSARGEYEITDAIQWLIHQGYNISYSETKEHFTDVGTVDRWLEANRWMQDFNSKLNRISKQSTLVDCIINPPVSIAEGCYIQNSVIGPYVSIGPNVKLNTCILENSIILENSEILQSPSPIKNSVLGRYSQIHGTLGNVKAVEYIIGDQSSVIIRGLEEED